MAKILEEAVGEEGSIYRFGGDEFVLFLLHGEEECVEGLAKCIAKGISEDRIENINSNVIPEITISQGYSCFVPCENEDVDSLIEHADKALYYVKNHGRNGYHVIVES